MSIHPLQKNRCYKTLSHLIWGTVLAVSLSVLPFLAISNYLETSTHLRIHLPYPFQPAHKTRRQSNHVASERPVSSKVHMEKSAEIIASNILVLPLVMPYHPASSTIGKTNLLSTSKRAHVTRRQFNHHVKRLPIILTTRLPAFPPPTTSNRPVLSMVRMARLPTIVAVSLPAFPFLCRTPE